MDKLSAVWLQSARTQNAHVVFRACIDLKESCEIEVRCCAADWFSLYVDKQVLLNGPMRFHQNHPEYGFQRILDNARFHRKSAVQRILKKVGCRALFLPPYSPDLNPIEHQWHRLKARVRTLRQHGLEFKQALEAALM